MDTTKRAPPAPPSAAPAPAPRPAAPVQRSTTSENPKTETVCYLVAAPGFHESPARAVHGNTSPLVLLLSSQGTLHSTSAGALANALERYGKRAYQVRITVEVMGELEAAVRPLKG